jgi:hypothetical protein
MAVPKVSTIRKRAKTRSAGSGAFLSYRHADSDYAALLYLWLAERFGSEKIFWDREDIDPGADFRATLSRRLGDMNALVALIGPGWAPSAWIKRELGKALARDVLVLPVLIGGASNPAPDTLPKSLRRLASIQSIEVGDSRFRERLLRMLEPVMPPSVDASSPRDGLAAGRISGILLKQSDKARRRGLELMVEHDTEHALDTFNDAFEMLMVLIELSPRDTALELRLGFLYKHLAQAFFGDPTRFERYASGAARTFETLLTRKLGTSDAASTWNGLGNIALLRGDARGAVEYCKKAVELVPDYSFAWNDLFTAKE